MRNKILVDINCLAEKNIYDVIMENGNYEEITFSDTEINDLLKSGYFDYINENNDLSIDIFEEEVVCDTNKIEQILSNTKAFKLLCNNTQINVLSRIEALLELAVNTKSCVYFII